MSKNILRYLPALLVLLAASGVPADIPHRGYQLMQRITAGSKFDTNVTHSDNFQGTVIWCKPLLS